MAIQIQLRQGTTTEHNTFKGAVGEVTVDTTKDTLVVHDGVTVGGFPVAARANNDGTISLIKKDGTVSTTIPANGLLNNTLTSTATNQALTATQGKVLQDNKLDKTSAFGVGQTYQDVTASRTSGTTYTNTTGKMITVIFQLSSTNSATATATVDGKSAGQLVNNPQYVTSVSMCFPVPPNSTYKITGTMSGSKWIEVR